MCLPALYGEEIVLSCSLSVVGFDSCKFVVQTVVVFLVLRELSVSVRGKKQIALIEEQNPFWRDLAEDS